MAVDDLALGFIIIASSMVSGFLFCIGICLVLWVRYKEGALPTLWSKMVVRQGSARYSRTQTEIPSSELLVFPTISYSETGSEPCSPISNLSTSSPLSPSRGKALKPMFEGQTGSRGLQTQGPPVREKLQINPNQPLGGTLSKASIGSIRPKTRPSTLTLKNTSFPSSFTSPALSSESGTSASPSEYESLKRSLRNADWFVECDSDASGHVKGIPVSSRLPHSIHPSVPFAGERIHKLKIGILKINIKYKMAENILRIALLQGFQFPFHCNYEPSDLYSKFFLTLGEEKIRCSKPLESGGSKEELNLSREETTCSVESLASFECFAPAADLSNASLVITLCKRMEDRDQGMVIGSTFVSFKELGIKESHDFDSGVLELPLGDSNPFQMIYCGGSIQANIALPVRSSQLILSSIQMCGMDFSKILSKDEKVQIYLKITIYERGEPKLWRRSVPVVVSIFKKDVLLANQVVLDMSLKDLSTIQLVMSVRLKTGRRGERCVLGGVYLSESWFSSELEKRSNDGTQSPNVSIHFPLTH